MSSMVKYRNMWLAKNSDAYDMWEKKDFAALDKHLKSLDKNEADLLARFKEKQQ